METEGTGAKSFLIRDLLRDLIVKNTENDETSDNDDSGKLIKWEFFWISVKEIEHLKQRFTILIIILQDFRSNFCLSKHKFVIANGKSFSTSLKSFLVTLALPSAATIRIMS